MKKPQFQKTLIHTDYFYSLIIGGLAIGCKVVRSLAALRYKVHPWQTPESCLSVTE